MGQLIELKAKKGQVLKQYVKDKHITDKDHTTKIFDEITSFSVEKKIITRIKFGGITVKRIRNIEIKIREHYIEHFNQQNFPKITLPLGSFKRLSLLSTTFLDKFINANEILDAAKSCDPRKSSGYDDFNLRFIIKL